jgi:hypothetical protein
MNKTEEKRVVEESEENIYRDNKTIEDLFKDMNKKIIELCEHDLKVHRKPNQEQQQHHQQEPQQQKNRQQEEEQTEKSIAIPCDYVLGWLIVSFYNLSRVNNNRRSNGEDKFELKAHNGWNGIQFKNNRGKESCLELIPLMCEFKDDREKNKEIERWKISLMTSMKRFKVIYETFVRNKKWKPVENPRRDNGIFHYPTEDSWIAFECIDDGIIHNTNWNIAVSHLMTFIIMYLQMDESIAMKTDIMICSAKTDEMQADQDLPLFLYVKRFEYYKTLHRCGLDYFFPSY